MRSECIRFGAIVMVACGVLLNLDSPVRSQEAGGTGSLMAGSGAPPKSFYAAGTLQKVRRKDNGSERIALTDGEGRITAFVAPTVRLDFQRFMGREVAIKGRILNANDDNAPYIAADTITEMYPFSDTSSSNAKGNIATVSFEDEYAPENLSLAQHMSTGPIISGQALPGQVFPGQVIAGQAVPGQWQSTPGTTIIDEGGGMVSELPPGTILSDTSIPGVSVGGAACDSCGISAGDPCATCGSANCNSCTLVTPCTCGPPGWLWLRGEYLAWWGEGMDVPPLVTTGSSADPATAGVLGQPGTTILYGGDSILHGSRSGFRINFGGFFGPTRKVGWEAEYLNVGSVVEHFEASSDTVGNPVIARPFVNVNPRDENGNPLPPGSNDVQFVAFPGLVAGTVAVDTDSTLQATAGRLRLNICCKQFQRACGPCARVCGYPPFMKVDFTAGYRHASLDESLIITEDLNSLQDPESIEIVDSFQTRSDFHGGEIGTCLESGWNRWTFDTLMRVALGGVRQEATINGSTTITTFGSPSQIFSGGFLTQSSNIGVYSRDDFAMVPELAANVGLYLTPRLRWTVGYTFFYFSNVVRPGDQIDLEVNPDFLAPPVPDPTGMDRPEFVFRTTDFWAHGLNTGLDFRW